MANAPVLPSVEQMRQRLAEIDPALNGYRVIRQMVGAEGWQMAGLQFCLYLGGALADGFVPLYWSPDGPRDQTPQGALTPQGYGALGRDQLLLEAMARYLNTGGCVENIARMATSLHRCQSMTIPDFTLVASARTDEGSYEHIYCNGPVALVWQEPDGFIDAVSTVELIRSWNVPYTDEELNNAFGNSDPGHLLPARDSGGPGPAHQDLPAAGADLP